MRVWEWVVMDAETGAILDGRWYEYDGPVAEAKGGASAQAKRDARAQREKEFQIALQQLNLQRQQLQDVRGGVLQFLSPEGEGFTDAELASLRGQAIDAVPQRFEDLERRLRTELARKGAVGGNIPISGDFGRDFGALGAQKEMFRTELLRDVDIRNALLKNQNRFNAANALLGVGAQFNPSNFLQASSSSLNAQVQAAQNQDQATSALSGALIGGAFGAAGSFLGRPPGGG